MESIIKIGFAGYSEYFEIYRKTLLRLPQVEFVGAWLQDETQEPKNYTEPKFESLQELINHADAIFFFGSKIKKNHLTEAIQALKHIFIDDYSTLMNGEFKDFETLSSEANIIAQVSFPKTYYWGIQDLAEEYPLIRNLYFYRECLYSQNKHEVDLCAEMLCALKLINTSVVRVSEHIVPLIAKRNQMRTINMEFANGATAHITGIPVGFFDCHELRINAERSMAYIDLRKREWVSLKPEKNITGTLLKGVSDLPEVGDTEFFEVQDFIHSIRTKTEPFISFNDIARLHRCIQLVALSNS